MSTLQEFLIKNAGMEKEAKGAFRKLLERGVNPYDDAIYSNITGNARSLKFNGIPGVRRAAAFRDLTTPLRDRVSDAYRGNPYFDSSVRSKFSEAYKSYLERVVDNSKDPRISDFVKYVRKINALHRFSPKQSASLNNTITDILSTYADDAVPDLNASNISFLKKYKVNYPYASTHHLANPELSLQANAMARNAPSGTTLIKNPDIKVGWKKWRSENFRVNRPRQKWTEDELHQMLTSDNLSGTPLYETVFAKGSNDFPAAISAYVPDTPEVRKILDIPDSVQSIPVRDIQSPLVDFVYKGTKPSLFGTTKQQDDLWQVMYNNLRKTVSTSYSDNELSKILANWKREAPQNTFDAKYPERWFAPAAKTSAGYIGAADQKFIKLDTNSLANYRRAMREEQRALSDIIDRASEAYFSSASQQQLAEYIRAALRTYRINRLQNIYLGKAYKSNLSDEMLGVLRPSV